MKKRVTAALLTAAILCGGAIGFSAMGYDASEAAAALMPEDTAGSAAVFTPEEIRAGMVFYPGGLVDHRAYAPLMQAFCDRGILCLLAEMPLDLAVLDKNAAAGLAARYPDVDKWIIGGHSLGGAMAAAYVAAHAEEFDAVLLLGAYSPEDLSGTELQALSVLGSNDGVLNREKYAQSLAYYPAAFVEVILEGGCHANFGDYGAQKGDGQPTMTREEQMEKTADAVSALVDRL